VISGFHSEADENCTLQGCYGESSGNSLPTIKIKFSVFGFLALEVLTDRLSRNISKYMKREDQQDATIRCLLLTSVSTCFGHHYAHLQENKGPVTAFGVLF